MTVGVNILTEQGDFLYAALDQHIGFAHNLRYRAAYFSAAPIRDYAECAELVAAVNNGDICRNIRASHEWTYAAFGVDVHALAEQVYQRLILLRLHEDVNVGEAFFEIVRLGTDHASHQRHDLVLVALLERLQTGHHAHDTVFGALAHDTAIQHDNIRLFRRGTRGESHLPQRAFEAFRICLIHLAADCPDVVTVHL